MSSKNRLALAALPAAAAALVALLVAAPAAPAADLQSKLEDKEAKLSHVRERKGVLTTTISRYGARIEKLTSEVAALRTEEAAVRERLVAMYETGTPDVLSIILDSNGYDELATRTEYLERIHGMDEAVVGRVRDLRDQVKDTVARLRSAKNRIEAARDAIAAEKDALVSARQAVQGRQAKLVATRAQREEALARIDSTAEELHDEVASLQGEIAAQLAGYGSAPLPAGPIVPGSSGSGLIWPVSGAVVSGFGMRWGQMHEGIDIAVPAGTPIRAAASGTVILVQGEAESGGYGNFTCLEHGGGLQTCYAHQSAVAVGSGKSVSQGDII